MYRFVLLALVIVSFTVIALRHDGRTADAAAPRATLWSQAHTALPGTHYPPFAPASSWSGRLNPAGTVFESGFRAFYFDRTDPSFEPVERQVESVALSYIYDDLQGIDSSKLGAYWIGRVRFEAETLRRINLSLSHAAVRLFIDGKLIHEGGSSHSLEYRFSPGFHLIEVDYVNNWHTTAFAVTMTDPSPMLSRGEIATRVSGADPSRHDIYYFGAYESAAGSGGPIALRLPESSRPAIVWLDSNEPVAWSVDAADREVWAVVASREPGASVTGVRRDRVFLTPDRIGVTSEVPADCACHRSYFHCESDDAIRDAANALSGMFGNSITGYAVAYNASAMTVRPYDALAVQRLLRAEARVAQQEALCRA